MKLVFACFAATCLWGCAEVTNPCPMGQVRTADGHCIPDADSGGVDSGPDTGIPTDAGPCGHCAAGQVCVVSGAMHSCEQCAGDGDCLTTGHLRCDMTRHRCVDCTTPSDCIDPTAARCNTEGSCVACEGNTDCAHVAGGRVLCETSGGACVQCTLADQTACVAPNPTCDLLEHRCVSTPMGMTHTCEACTNDNQCVSGGSRCARMEFPSGTPHGYYCLPPAGACVAPFRVPINRRDTLSSAAPADFCGIDEALTTCEAVLDLVHDRPCDSSMMCPEGGLCRTVSSTMNRCTYACDDVSGAQCLGGTTRGNTCGVGATSGPMYCGG